MGYTTDFNGVLKLNRALSAEMKEYLIKFNESRRMARNVDTLNRVFKGQGGLPQGLTGAAREPYGMQGEYFVEGGGFMGQENDDSVIDHNSPAKTQPGLWCQWRPTDDGAGIEWDGGEKFYNYVEWLEYIVKNFLAPNGYKLTGAVQWRGEDFSDLGTILVQDNEIKVIEGKHVDLPKRKGAKPKENPEFLIKSRRIDGVVYFRSDSLLDALNRVNNEGDERLNKALIKMLKDIAAK